MRLYEELGNLVFKSSIFFTRESTDCDDPEAEPIIGTEVYYTMPDCIMDLNGGQPTVAYIYELANDALGGESVPCLLGDITTALGIINDAMDECCFIYFYNGAPIASPISSNENEEEQADADVADVMMSISPNPFQDQVEIKYNLKTDSRVSLELYNLQGVKVYTIYEGEAKAGFEYALKFAPIGNRGEQVFLVVLKSVYGATTRQIIKIY